MTIEHALDKASWDYFLARQRFRPFLQSWTMGEVYRDVGQEPIRLCIKEAENIVGICYGHQVLAKRGRHIAIPYGPLFDESLDLEKKTEAMHMLLSELSRIAKKTSCSFLRCSPFVPETSNIFASSRNAVSSPLHLLAEQVWYVPLTEHDIWSETLMTPGARRSEESILMAMRKTTRNLIRRAEKDGVTIVVSSSPEKDLEDHFIRLHDETRKRHKFTPYTNAFFRAQVKHFVPRSECTVYLAKHAGEVIAASVHMHAYGETSYHHGASSSAHHKIPASYLLQWRAMQDAMKRGDHVYNFWGIAPTSSSPLQAGGSPLPPSRGRHPFAGVTLFKTGFGGSVLNLVHCHDIPLSKLYWLTYGFEIYRRWRRGF